MTDFPYIINGRFVTQPLTGIQRYGYELSRRLQMAKLLSPSPALAEYAAVRSRVVTTATYIRGHSWEQLGLPLSVPKHSVLFSPAGCGPLAYPNQVLTIHDLAPLENARWYSRAFALWYRRLLPPLSRRTRKILTVSAFCKQRIVELLGVPEDKITVAPEAAGPCFSPRSHAEIRGALQRLGIPSPFFLVVGAFSGRKNLPRIFGAWNRAMKKVDGTILVVVGKVGLRFSDAAGMGPLPDRVIHLSSVNDRNLACLYSAARGLLYPSLYEGFGLPILEAMACGCPVLTSNCSAMPEVAADAAILVDPLSEESIAEGIVSLTQESQANELRRRGLLRCNSFSWERTTEIVKHALLN